jgi:hypothetical protein
LDADFGKTEGRDRFIDWGAVSAAYGGVEFRNYLNTLSAMVKTKDDPMWYYLIDASSGYIWDPDLLSGPPQFVRFVQTRRV